MNRKKKKKKLSHLHCAETLEMWISSDLLGPRPPTPSLKPGTNPISRPSACLWSLHEQNSWCLYCRDYCNITLVPPIHTLLRLSSFFRRSRGDREHKRVTLHSLIYLFVPSTSRYWVPIMGQPWRWALRIQWSAILKSGSREQIELAYIGGFGKKHKPTSISSFSHFFLFSYRSSNT